MQTGRNQACRRARPQVDGWSLSTGLESDLLFEIATAGIIMLSLVMHRRSKADRNNRQGDDLRPLKSANPKVSNTGENFRLPTDNTLQT